MTTGVAIRCDGCGAAWDAAGARYCGRCGARLDDTAPTPAAHRRRPLAAMLVGAVLVVALAAISMTGPLGLDLTWSRPDPEVALPGPGVVPDGTPLSPGEQAEALAPFDEDRLRCDPAGCERWRLDLERFDPGWGARFGGRIGFVPPGGQPAEGVLVVRDADRLVAIDAATGDRVWETELVPPDADELGSPGMTPISTIDVDHDLVVVSGSLTRPGWVRAYDPTNGQERWTAMLEHGIHILDVVTPTSVAVTDGDGAGAVGTAERLTVLDAADGSVRWAVEATSVRVTSHGVIVVEDGVATVRDPDTGEVTVTAPVGDGQLGTAGPWLVTVSGPNELVALDPTTGEEVATFAELWVEPVRIGGLWVTLAVLPDEPAPDDGTGDPGRRHRPLSAVGLTSAGETIWRRTVGQQASGQCCPVLTAWHDGTVLVRADGGGPLYVLDAATGDRRTGVTAPALPPAGWRIGSDVWMGTESGQGSVELTSPRGSVRIAGRTPWVLHADPLVVADENTLMGVELSPATDPDS